MKNKYDKEFKLCKKILEIFKKEDLKNGEIIIVIELLRQRLTYDAMEGLFREELEEIIKKGSPSSRSTPSQKKRKKTEVVSPLLTRSMLLIPNTQKK